MEITCKLESEDVESGLHYLFTSSEILWKAKHQLLPLRMELIEVTDISCVSGIYYTVRFFQSLACSLLVADVPGTSPMFKFILP